MIPTEEEFFQILKILEKPKISEEDMNFIRKCYGIKIND